MDYNRSYECVGGPWDGRFHVMHQGNELRIHMTNHPGAMALTDDPMPEAPEIRVGVYQLYRPKKKHLTYLKWMGERDG